MFIWLLTSKVSVPNHTKCVLLYNQKCMAQPFLINSHTIEYSHIKYYYPFTSWLR